jgi:ABC-type amino acid transport substrate-binding protein
MRLLLFGFLITSATIAAHPSQLKFVLYYPQVPPYMYTNLDSEQVDGVVPQLLSDFFVQQHISVKYVIDNRKGAEFRLYQGDVDAMLMAASWAQYPDKLVFSAPILEHRDYLYSLQPFKDPASVGKWLSNASICTRQYYVYEALTPYFKLGAKRIDASSEQAQMRMLISGRCDYAYMNEHVSSWLQYSQFPSIRIYQSQQSFGHVGLTVAFHAKWADMLPALNAYLQQQQETGRLQQILQQELQKKGRFTPAPES